MATAQMTGPRSARLADDVQPRRKASVREKTTSDTHNQGAKGASTLSAASAGAAIAHANRRPVEIWRPGRLTEAETAALCVKDFKAPETPKPSTQYSAEGLGAAILAVREQRNSNLSPTREQQNKEYSRDVQDKALRAATGAYATGRKRADSAPSEPVIASDSPYALSAAGATHSRYKTEEEEPLDHLDSAMEASRIRHLANTNAKLYTSSPPISSEVQERNRKNSLHAAAISMARDMYDPNNPKVPVRSKTVSGIEGSPARRAMTLQEAAQKRAAEKLALMHNEQAEFQNYYGTTPQPARSRLTTRRKRTASDADSTQMDAEQSKYIRNQMRSLRTKVDHVDEKRTRDRALLMEAARRNVDATLLEMETKMYADTGRAPPSLQKEWDEVAHERVRREAEAAEANSARGNRVNIGSQQYMDMADVEAVARSRLQPTLDEITENAEQQRAKELEERLDAEEQQRHAAIEREREASLSRVVDSRNKSSDKEKRNSKVMSFLWRMKSKRARVEKNPSEEAVETTKQEESNEEAVAQDEAEAAPEAIATATGAVLTDATKEGPEEEPEKELEHEPVQEPTPEPTPEPVEEPVQELERKPEEEPAAIQAPEAPEPAGATTLVTAAHVGAPVSITEPTEYAGRPTMVGRAHTTPRDAAAVGAGPAPMHVIRPITSPRADSKLRNWFRDQLVRRSSGPVRVYPHQPGPDFNSHSDVGFSGGASLAARPESRGAALSSHPFTGDDLDQGEPARNGSLDVGKGTAFSDSSAGSEPATNGQAKSKRERFRKTFFMGIARNDLKTNGSGAVPETKVHGTDIRGLRNSATDQGLPIPPILGETSSAYRESRFSEDLS
ncbi:hypothetical protein N7466_000044 [Penicillium verhagenii]|uniref:uncharacterized protein n=1 Tax=Penicillium verhagenii TaxID=1562060 RepID=UPI0025455AA8|nr:uncharacterized protein N7466_000044 [Penicillium verhagenii]KAJ5947029.1 hypothetical protein N7466_000044 [Penicillium verhagenii]